MPPVGPPAAAASSTAPAATALRSGNCGALRVWPALDDATPAVQPNHRSVVHLHPKHHAGLHDYV